MGIHGSGLALRNYVNLYLPFHVLLISLKTSECSMLFDCMFSPCIFHKSLIILTVEDPCIYIFKKGNVFLKLD